MSNLVDLDVLKDIPGYKAILKAVLKSQIQLLVEQLSQQTEEESVLLTASVTEGTLSQLGSDSGREFLLSKVDLKSQFLGFCLKRKHRINQQPPPQASVPQYQSYMGGLSQDTNNQGNKSYSGPQKRNGGAKSYHNSPSNSNTSYSHTSDDVMSSPDFYSGGNNLLKRRVSASSAYENAKVNKKSSADIPVSSVDKQTMNAVQSVSLPVDNVVDHLTSSSATETSQTVTNLNIKTETPADDDLVITGVEMGTKAEGNQLAMDGDQGGSNEGGLGGSNFSTSEQGLDVQSENDNWKEKLGTNSECMLVDQGTVKITSYLSNASKTIHSTDTVPNVYKDRDIGLDTIEDIIRPHACDYCGRRFKRREHLKAHTNLHTGERPHQCSICNVGFAAKSGLMNHFNSVHNLSYSEHLQSGHIS